MTSAAPTLAAFFVCWRPFHLPISGGVPPADGCGRATEAGAEEGILSYKYVGVWGMGYDEVC